MLARFRAPLAAAFSALALVSCSMSSQSLPYMQNGAALRYLSGTGAGKIDHIVYVVQENRSFNNLFMGYPHALTVTSGKDSSGNTVTLAPVSLADKYEIDHELTDFLNACDGTGKLRGTKCRNDAFDKEYASGGPSGIEYPEYVYAPRKETKPYWDMAHEWVLADHMFQSQLDESFVAHQYIIAAQAQSAVNLPGGYWGCYPSSGSSEVATINAEREYGGYESACFDYQTLGDELDKANLSWRFYTGWYNVGSGQGGFWSSYQAVKHIFNGPDWKKDVIVPQKRFLTDVKAGKLADFTWITPICDDSDHVNCGGGYGPSWVAAIVNAVGKSKFWDTTAIFVQWDDWGGLYDPVPPPPPYYPDGLGFRVPLLVISPYAKHDYVSHVQYETASVLRFAEDLWGLGRLTKVDTRAKSPAGDCFDFSQNPRAFVPIKAPHRAKFFVEEQPPDTRIPDDE